MQLETVIDAARALRAEGIELSQNKVLAKLGTGSKRDLVSLWPDVLRALGEPVPVPVPTVQAQLQEAYATRALTTQRLHELAAIAQRTLLSPDEETEQIRLERRLSNLEPIIARLQYAVQHAQQTADIDAVLAAWSGLVEEKLQAYAAFEAAVGFLWDTLHGILAVHRRQAAVLAGLPRAAQEKLAFPDVQSLRVRIAGRMPGAWWQVLGNQPPPPRMAEVMDVDPGTRLLNPRLLEPYRQEE